MEATIPLKINFYATFRPVIGGKSAVLALPEGSTIWQLVAVLIEQYPALGPQLLDEHGRLFSHVHIFVNGRDAPYLTDGMDTVLTASDTIDIFPPVGGG